MNDPLKEEVAKTSYNQVLNLCSVVENNPEYSCLKTMEDTYY